MSSFQSVSDVKNEKSRISKMIDRASERGQLKFSQKKIMRLSDQTRSKYIRADIKKAGNVAVKTLTKKLRTKRKSLKKD